MRRFVVFSLWNIYFIHLTHVVTIRAYRIKIHCWIALAIHFNINSIGFWSKNGFINYESEKNNNTNSNYGSPSTFQLFHPLKIKSAATEVTAQKTQTPIVAKLTNVKWVQTHNIHTLPDLHFYQIQNNICITTIKRNYPYKKKNTPNFTQYSVSLALLVYHTSFKNAIYIKKER